MEKETLTKELAKKLLEIKGEVRGATLKSDWSFILEEEGKESLEKLENKMAEFGCPIKYKEIKTGGFYPIGCGAISIQLTRDIFGYNEKELKEMSASQFKFSKLFKVLMNYFVILSPAWQNEIPQIWRKNYTVGELKVEEINKKEKYMILTLKNFKIHPNFCITLEGAFNEGIKMISASGSAYCQKTKCIFKGDDFCEFLGKW